MNLITWDRSQLESKRNRVRHVVGPVSREYEEGDEMKGSDLFSAGKKTGKETGDLANDAFKKGKASGRDAKEKGKEAGNDATGKKQ